MVPFDDFALQHGQHRVAAPEGQPANARKGEKQGDEFLQNKVSSFMGLIFFISIDHYTGLPFILPDVTG